MKIEVGKIYQDGLARRIYIVGKVDVKSSHPYIGHVMVDDTLVRYQPDGTAYAIWHAIGSVYNLVPMVKKYTKYLIMEEIGPGAMGPRAVPLFASHGPYSDKNSAEKVAEKMKAEGRKNVQMAVVVVTVEE